LLLGLLIVDGFFLGNTARLLLAAAGSPGGLLPAAGPALAASGVVLLFLVALHWQLSQGPEPGLLWREDTLARAGMLGAVGLGLVFALAVNSRLNYPSPDVGGPELLRPQVLQPEVRELVAELSAWARQDPVAPIAVGEALRPWLIWHVRDVPTVQFQEQTEEGRRGVWAAGSGAPAGERRQWGTSTTVGPIPNTGAVWNWWLYRNAWLLPSRHDIIIVR
jgi:hypothetical protein